MYLWSETNVQRLGNVLIFHAIKLYAHGEPNLTNGLLPIKLTWWGLVFSLFLYT